MRNGEVIIAVALSSIVVTALLSIGVLVYLVNYFIGD